jgi:hypothetical protein
MMRLELYCVRPKNVAPRWRLSGLAGLLARRWEPPTFSAANSTSSTQRSAIGAACVFTTTFGVADSENNGLNVLVQKRRARM